MAKRGIGAAVHGCSKATIRLWWTQPAVTACPAKRRASSLAPPHRFRPFTESRFVFSDALSGGGRDFSRQHLGPFRAVPGDDPGRPRCRQPIFRPACRAENMPLFDR